MSGELDARRLAAELAVAIRGGAGPGHALQFARYCKLALTLR